MEKRNFFSLTGHGLNGTRTRPNRAPHGCLYAYVFSKYAVDHLFKIPTKKEG